MKILILGGTGTMGYPLSQELKEDNEVWVLCRKHKENEDIHLKYIYGDFSDENVQKMICNQNWDTIVDFLWHNDANYHSTYNKLVSCSSHYIFLSSAAVYAANNRPMREDDLRFYDELNPALRLRGYHIEKARMEEVIINSENTHWTIVRPHVVFNTNRIPMDIWELSIWMNRLKDGKEIVLTQELLEKHTNFTYGNVIAKQIKAIIYKRNQTYSQIYNVASSSIYTWGDIIQKICNGIRKASGKELGLIILPSDNKMSDLITNLPNKADRLSYDRLLDRVVDTSKINKLTKSKTEYEDIESVIFKCVKNQYEITKDSPIIYDDPISVAFMDRIAKKHTNIKCFLRKIDAVKYLFLRYVLTYSISINIYKKIKNGLSFYNQYREKIVRQR